jgi:serine/threonine protein kinase/Flp pilus assembly protein TadD
MSTPVNPARAIFLEAIEQPDAAARVRFIDHACAGDADLRLRVERLLESHKQLGSFLDEPPSPEATIAQSLEKPGTQIGPYKLLQQIGEGGMGVVYMAEQERPVKRRLALKIIKPGMDTRQEIARFEAERQALALMDHPSIARVIDGGATSTGRPYFVMELVKGQPITQFCDEHQLTPRQRLELLLPVCQAMEHAHQKGIIHRDLKPANVLVAEYDQQPVPKVIDFGVAKATGQSLTERTMFTGFGQIVGTLEYMSPEQAKVNQLDIDTRSDIYSLGVLMYELLAGSTPLDRRQLADSSLPELLRMVREQDAPTLSHRLNTTEELPAIAARRGVEPAKLKRLVRGELDWIVAKALEKQRTRRYETAGAFAADLRRFLNDEPVEACPPSVPYRLRKFARRNRGGLSVAALMLLLLVLLGSAVGWAVRDRSARDAEAARTKADRQTKVTGQIELIRGEVERLLREQQWSDALNVARRAEAIAIGGEADPATAERFRELLSDLAFLDRLEQIRMQRATPVSRGFDFAAANAEYSKAFREFGVDALNLPVEKSIALLKSRSAISVPLAAALDDWVLCRRGILRQEGADWKSLVSVAGAIDPDPLRGQVRATWGKPAAEVREELRALANSIDVRTQHPATLLIIAVTLNEVSQWDAAARMLRDAQSMHPADFWLNYELGYTLALLGDLEGAVRYRTVAVAIRPHSGPALNSLGQSLARQGRLDEAIACLVRANEINPRYHFELGKLLERHQRSDEAIAVYRQGLEHLSPTDVRLHLQLASALRKRGDFEEAITAVRQAIDRQPQQSGYHYYLAMLEVLRADKAGYRKVCSGMLDTFKESLDAYTAACACALGPDAMTDWSRPLEAAQTADVARQTKYETITLVGALLYRAGRFQEAAQRLTEAETKHQPRALGARAYNYFFQAMVHHRLGDIPAAERWLEKAVPNIDEAVEGIDEKPADQTWGAWNDVLFGLLRRETEELLGKRAP